MGRQESCSLNQLLLTQFLALPKHGKLHFILGLFLVRNPKKNILTRCNLTLVRQPPDVTPSYVILSCYGSQIIKHNESYNAFLSNRHAKSSATQTFTWLNAWHFYPRVWPILNTEQGFVSNHRTFVRICLLLNRFSNHFPEAMGDSKAQVLCCHLARFENSRSEGIK